MSLTGRGFIGAGALLAMYAYVAGRSFVDHSQRAATTNTYNAAAPIPAGGNGQTFFDATLGSVVSPEDQGLNAGKKKSAINKLGANHAPSNRFLNRSLAGFTSGVPKQLGFDLSGKRLQVSILCNLTSDCPYIDAMVDALKTETHSIIEQMYAGKVPDLSGQPSTDATIEVPICNRNADAFDGNESATNHLGQSCGAAKCSLTPGGKIGTPPVVDMKSCQTERAWARGEMIHDIDKALDDVLTEYTVNHYVMISDRCTAIVNDPNLCLDVTSYNSMVSTLINDRRIPIQAGSQLNSGYSALWAALTSMSLCEVFSRADIHWNNQSLPSLDASFSKTILGAGNNCGPEPSAKCLTTTYARTISDAWNSNDSTAFIPSPRPYAVNCVKGASDCQCTDLSFCGTGSALSRIELFKLSNAVQSLRAAGNSLEVAKSLLSPPDLLAMGLDPGTATASCYQDATSN